MKDDETVFINSDGEPKDKISFTWSENPITLCKLTILFYMSIDFYF